MWPVAEMASKILRRVLSASAFDIFSTSEGSIIAPQVLRSHHLGCQSKLHSAEGSSDQMHPITSMFIKLSKCYRPGRQPAASTARRGPGRKFDKYRETDYEEAGRKSGSSDRRKQRHRAGDGQAAAGRRSENRHLGSQQEDAG